MNFLKDIIQSIYAPDFYSDLPQKTFMRSIGYFLLLILLITIIQSAALIGPLIIDTPVKLQGFIQDTIRCFPEDLEIKIANGQVSVNKPEPYFVSSCGGFEEKDMQLLVIDTKTPFSSEKFDQYKVGAWITKDTVFYKQNNYETRSYSLNQIKEYKLNQSVLNSYANIVSPWLKFVGPVLLLFAFIGIYLAYDFRLIHILILAVLIWILGKAFKKTLTYTQSYKVGLHAITLGLIVELIISLTNRWTNINGFPFMFSILTLGVVIVNLFIKRKTA